MKWYKRDPDAAIAGMIGLTLEERGAYNTLLDLLYSRDGNVVDDDGFMARALECRPQVWRRVKAGLIAKGKIRETGGKLTANRVEKELQTARKLIANMVHLGQVSAEKRNKNKARPPTAPFGTSTSTSTSREERKREPTRERAASPMIPLPENWMPKDGIDALDIPLFETMKDWAKANAIRRADWEAQWRNFKRRESKFKREGNGNGSNRTGGSVVEAIQQARRRLASQTPEDVDRQLQEGTICGPSELRLTGGRVAREPLGSSDRVRDKPDDGNSKAAEVASITGRALRRL